MDGVSVAGGVSGVDAFQHLIDALHIDEGRGQSKLACIAEAKEDVRGNVVAEYSGASPHTGAPSDRGGDTPKPPLVENHPPNTQLLNRCGASNPSSCAKSQDLPMKQA